MKLKNKKTGEIVSLEGEITYDDKVRLLKHYNSLAELNEEWGDLPKEEPEEHWVIDIRYGVGYKPYLEEPSEIDFEIENYFETREEAELAVKKLKALKRLKDAGFKFTEWYQRSGSYNDEKYEGEFVMFSECDNYVNEDDLDLLFGK